MPRFRVNGPGYDFLLTRGYLVDGTGNPWVRADVAIARGRIAAVGHLERGEAKRVVDVDGLVVAPGFIDIHGHSDFTLLVDGDAQSKVRQGVTTEVVGNCGLSAAPCPAAARAELAHYVRNLEPHINWEWESTAEYLGLLEEQGVSLNVAALAGHRTLRMAVMGMANREAKETELAAMKGLLETALSQGAMGLSSGLAYAPSCAAGPGELIELCRVVHRHHGYYASHIRNDGPRLMEALEETFAVARASGEPVEISHHKGIGRLHRGRARAILEYLDKVRARWHLDVSFDIYPYTASSTWLWAYLPEWCTAGGQGDMVDRLLQPEVRARLRQELPRDIFAEDPAQGLWSETVIARVLSGPNKPLEGRSLAEAARHRGQDPYDTMFDLIIEERGSVTVVKHELAEPDLVSMIKHPLAAVGSDGYALSTSGPLAEGKPHPRSFGTFPRVLSRYVREQGHLTLEDAVRKMTSLPAQRLGLRGRGLITENAWADLVVFDPERVRDRATYASPFQYPEGICLVMVNGEPVVMDGAHTGARPGRALRRAGTGRGPRS
ncbi:MAG: D-aminoacylase [Bacillota bacterium]